MQRQDRAWTLGGMEREKRKKRPPVPQGESRAGMVDVVDVVDLPIDRYEFLPTTLKVAVSSYC